MPGFFVARGHCPHQALRPGIRPGGRTRRAPRRGRDTAAFPALRVCMTRSEGSASRGRAGAGPWPRSPKAVTGAFPTEAVAWTRASSWRRDHRATRPCVVDEQHRSGMWHASTAYGTPGRADRGPGPPRTLTLVDTSWTCATMRPGRQHVPGSIGYACRNRQASTALARKSRGRGLPLVGGLVVAPCGLLLGQLFFLLLFLGQLALTLLERIIDLCQGWTSLGREGNVNG